MKKTVFQIAVAVMLLMVGCAKDELIDEASENKQLKKGSSTNTQVSSIGFTGNSLYNNDFFILEELNDGSKIMKNGKISGSITGFGKINASLSTYKFTSISSYENTSAGQHYDWYALEYNYILVGSGRVYLNSVDYFEFIITEGWYNPGNSSPGVVTPEIYHGGIFICNNAGQGAAKVTVASGKFEAFAGRPLEVYRAYGYTGINRETGKLDLAFVCRLTDY